MMNNLEKEKRVEIQVFGIVQGVFFRANTRDYARKLGVKGTVRNRFDGSVEIIAEGREEKLNELIAFAKVGPPSSKVYNIEINWGETKGEFSNFRIIYQSKLKIKKHTE